MKLLYKFFLAFFITNFTIVCLLLVLIDNKFTANFENFVAKAENEQIENNKIQLIEIYQQHNNWQAIINDVQVWHEIVDARPGPPPRQKTELTSQPTTPAPPFKAPTDKPMGNNPPRPTPPAPPPLENINNPADFLNTGKRLSLYDSNKKVVFGNEKIAKDHRIEAITLNGNTIGWLGLKPTGSITESPASEFLAQLHQNIIYVGAITLSLAFFMAWLLSKHLIAPIKKVIAGTNKLIAGNYHNRITKVTQDEIGTLSDDVNNLAHTLEQAQKNRFQWMTDTSHELRTPLTVLKSQLEAIQDGLMQADEPTLIQIIDEINNLSNIVDDLYQLSSSEAGALTYKKTLLNPTQILKLVMNNFQSKLLKKSLASDYSSLKNISCSMLADKDRLIQLFSNLLENCYRYTNANGKIRINADIINNGKKIKFEIEDSNPGVNHEEKKKMFERFYRIEKSRNRSQGGSGLGLSLCQQIVQAHNGSIEVTDSSLGGIKMTINFPLH